MYWPASLFAVIGRAAMMNRYAQGSMTITYAARPATASAPEGAFAEVLR